MPIIAIVQAAQGTTAGMPGYDPRADVIRDGAVNQQDLAVIAGKIADVNARRSRELPGLWHRQDAFGKRRGQVGLNPAADINGDGIIDASDLSIVSLALPAGLACH